MKYQDLTNLYFYLLLKLINMSWKIVEIRDMLKEMLDKFEEINDETVEQQNNIEKIEENYVQYNNLIKKGGDIVNDIANREYYETLFVYFGIFFFFGCVIFVLLKRIPIHKIIVHAFELISKITNLNKNSDL